MLWVDITLQCLPTLASEYVINVTDSKVTRSFSAVLVASQAS